MKRLFSKAYREAFKEVFNTAGVRFRSRLATANVRLASTTATQAIARSSINTPGSLHSLSRLPKSNEGLAHRSLSARTFHAFSTSTRGCLPRAIPRNVNSVGLQSARNFSSTRPVFENLTQNVNLLIRAGYGLDIKSAGEPLGKGAGMKGRAGGKDRASPFAPFASYKSSPLTSIPSSCTSSVVSEDEAHSQSCMDAYFPQTEVAQGVRFVIPAEPEYTVGSTTMQPGSRLLDRNTLATLHSITQAQRLHHDRFTSLTDRLDMGGCLVNHQSQLLVDPTTGSKQVVIDFDPKFQADDLRQAIGWEEPWFEIIEPLASQSGYNTPEASLSGYEQDDEDVSELEEEDEQMLHDLTAQSFVMPRLDSSVQTFLFELEVMPRPFV